MGKTSRQECTFPPAGKNEHTACIVLAFALLCRLDFLRAPPAPAGGRTAALLAGRPPAHANHGFVSTRWKIQRKPGYRPFGEAYVHPAHNLRRLRRDILRVRVPEGEHSQQFLDRPRGGERCAGVLGPDDGERPPLPGCFLKCEVGAAVAMVGAGIFLLVPD